jgi:hypothetical protein
MAKKQNLLWGQPTNDHERFSPKPVLQESNKSPMVSRNHPIPTGEWDDFQSIRHSEGLGRKSQGGELLATRWAPWSPLAPDSAVLITFKRL